MYRVWHIYAFAQCIGIWELLLYCTMEETCKLCHFKLLPVASQCHITLVPITWVFRPEFCISPWWSVAHICIDVVRECRSIILLLLNQDRYVHAFCYNCDVQASMCYFNVINCMISDWSCGGKLREKGIPI